MNGVSEKRKKNIFYSPGQDHDIQAAAAAKAASSGLPGAVLSERAGAGMEPASARRAARRARAARREI